MPPPPQADAAPQPDKEATLQRMEASLNKWKQRIQEFEGHAASKTQEGKEKLEQLKQQYATVESQFNALKQAGGDAWKEAHSIIDSTSQSFQDLGNFFGGK